MPDILLRDLIEGGFCWGYTPKGKVTLGNLRFALDNIAGDNTFIGCDQESARIELCNTKNVPYEHQPFFHRCLEGLNNNGSYFHSQDHEFMYMTAGGPTPVQNIQFAVIRDTTTGTFIEPVYDYVSMENYIPMHSIISAHLMGLTGEISVDCISVMSGPFSSKKWPIVESEIDALLGAVASPSWNPSPACASCDKYGCTFQTDFQSNVYAWMKARQAVDELEAKIRGHVTYSGPTKVGAHLVYLKENKRRSLPAEKREAFLELLKKERPNDWVDLLNPDTGELTRLAAKGKITKELVALFKESRFYTLDTTLTL